MGLQLHEVTADADFRQVVEVEWAAYSQPPSRLRPLFFPVLGTDEKARTAAFEESIDRQIAWHRSDPTSHWIKVVDDASGKVAGAALWHVYESNPFDSGSSSDEEEECTWWPEGEGREMANRLMSQWVAPRMKYMTKPHMFLDICFVHPDFRRQGAGRMLVGWGLERADEKRFETYIDSTEEGVPLYEACGFVKGGALEFSAEKKDPSERWKELQGEFLPFSWWPMWRPVGGQVESGTTVIPWDRAT